MPEDTKDWQELLKPLTTAGVQKTPTEDPADQQIKRAKDFQPSAPAVNGGIVYYSKGFFHAPQVLGVFMKYDDAVQSAWEAAKRKWRYTGGPRDTYSYFDQEIRVDSIIVRSAPGKI